MLANQALRSFHTCSALVVGDVMVDAYFIGDVNRISPEAPVPIVDIRVRDRRLGGAANVARNLKALGAKVYIGSVIGADEAGEKVQELCESLELDTQCIVSTPSRPTTVKTRIMSHGQQLLRVDEEVTSDIAAELEDTLIERCNRLLHAQRPDVLIFEDYDKGVLTPRVIASLTKSANGLGIPVTVDPKFNHFHAYRGVDLFKPNLKELREGLNSVIDKTDDNAIATSVEQLRKQLQARSIMVTLSERGIWIHQPESGVEHARIPAHPREIVDVSGAGDTVIAVASLLLAQGVAPLEIAAVANLAGGLVCEKVGVVPIDGDQLIAEWATTESQLPAEHHRP